MKEETFEEFKARLQNKYPDKPIEVEEKLMEDRILINLYGFKKNKDGKKEYRLLVGKYYKKTINL